MYIKILLITIVLVAVAIAGLLIKILIRPGSELPRSTCGYRKVAENGEEKCAVCELKNSDQCPSDNKLPVYSKNQKKIP